jgi:hypothetical protein
MAFRCGICGEAQPAGEKPVRVTIEERLIILDPIQEEQKETSEPGLVLVTVLSQDRREIVKQILACPKCAAKAGPPKIVEVISNVSDSRHQSREKVSTPAYLLYLLIAFSNPPFREKLIASAVFFITSFTIFSSPLLNF